MENESSLRDKLAVQRNKLANERTILAYIRTALSFIGFGILVLKIFHDEEYFFISLLSFIIGFVVIIFGIRSYRKHKKEIDQ